MNRRGWRRAGVGLAIGCVSLVVTAVLGPARGQTAGDPALVGQWSAVKSWPCVAIDMLLLPTGKVQVFDRYQQTLIWDPATDTFSGAPVSGTNLFCTGHAYLADGRILYAGGHNNQDGVGLPHGHIFDPFTNVWTRLPNLNAGRWYPTCTTMGNGDILVVSGSIDNSLGANRLPQVWSTAAGAWRNLTSAEMTLPLYPKMTLAPNGKAFMSGPQINSRYLDTNGTGTWTYVDASNFGHRDHGVSVLYDSGKIMIAGGHDPPTETAEVIDLNQPTPLWRNVGSMAYKRRHFNATLLADGSVLATGGTASGGHNEATGSVLPAEIWDPETEQWTTVASMAVRRIYHSTALLLPDGRVVSAGGGQPAGTGGDVDHPDMEVYSPPYLFKGARPRVDGAPAAIAWGQRFLIQTPDAASIQQAHLIGLGTVTHTTNMNQRLTKLPLTVVSGGLEATTPANGNLCPPGYYLLFVVNAQGVPSIGRYVRIGPGTVSLPSAPTGLTATAAGSTQINLAWTDTASNEDGFRIERMPAGGTWTQVAVAPANGRAYQSTGLAGNTTYSYRVRAYNAAGNSAYSNTATATTTNTPTPGTGTGLLGQYFNNADLTSPVMARTDKTIDFDWSSGSPATGMDGETFSARWTGQVQPLYTGLYTFTTTSDEGVRLWVNNVLVVDHWTAHTLSSKSGTIQLPAGTKYAIKLEYFESAGSAAVKLQWSCASQAQQVIPTSQLYPSAPPPGDGLKGDYFDNMDLTGLKLSRVDKYVSFDWGSGSPASVIYKDTFSVRWTGYMLPKYSQTYTFYTKSDNGARLWINGAQLINNWSSPTTKEVKGSITLKAGVKYAITMEYFENTSSASAYLSWSSSSQSKQIIPQSQLYTWQ